MSSAPTKAREIFTVAVEQFTPDQWSSYLDEACGDDLGLRRRVDLLLEAHVGDESILDSPAVACPTVEQPPITEKPGTQIGPYKLLQQIGEGGMGVVYMAEQKEPVKRRVALKIIKPGMDTRQVIARFEAERQALAMMDHPNIAKVLDAGQTESGRPYFVMELVKGIPVTKYCDEQHLTPKERLELFVPICQAVQHAHHKGIIHRDLKPSNILVALYDGEPVPKIIDFGVAKATSQTLTEKTMFTQVGQVVGTLEYMSPEQAQVNQLDVDTRSDVYSLGVVLYELLTGETPFDRERLRSAAFDEMLRIIREEEPSRPSTKVSSSQSLPTVAANRRIEPAKLGSMIRGELDWIVLKAMEKDRGRRYETASKFAEDVQHYLHDEPVVACPPSRTYRFRKFARRNRTAFAISAAIVMCLILGILGTSWQAIRAIKAEHLVKQRFAAEQQARDVADQAREAEAAQRLAAEQQRDRAIAAEEKAKTEAAIATAVNDFLNRDLLQYASPNIEPDRDLKLRTVLDRAAENIDGRFADKPFVEAAIRQTIGQMYLHLGEYLKAVQHSERARELCQSQLGKEHPNTLICMSTVGYAAIKLERRAEAERIFRDVAEIRQRVLGPEHPDTLSSLYHLALCLKGKEAERLEREVFETRSRVLGPEHPDTLDSMRVIAGRAFEQGRYSEAERLHREVLEIQKRVLEPENPGMLSNMSSLAGTIGRLGRYKEAEKLQREVLEIEKRVLGPEHPKTMLSMHTVAVTIYSDGRYAEAEKLFRELLPVQKRVLGPEHPETLLTLKDLAIAVLDQARYAEVEELCRELLEIQQRVLDPDSPEIPATKNALAHALRDQGRNEEAVTLYREAVDEMQRSLGNEHSWTLTCMMGLAAGLDQLKQHEEAEKVRREALEGCRRTLGSEHPLTLAIMNNIAVEMNRQRQFPEAEELMREGLEDAQRTLGSKHPITTCMKGTLANALEGKGDHKEAEVLLREVLETEQEVLGPEHPDTIRHMLMLANTISSQSRHAEAEKLFVDALEIGRPLGPEHPLTLCGMHNLARVIAVQGRHSEAEKLFREVLEIRRRVLGPEDCETLNSMLGVADSLSRQQREEEAVALYREVWEAQRRVLPPGHPHTLLCMKALAEVSANLSWRLATSADDSRRSPAKAVEMANLAIELRPDSANNWNNLGVAQYRAGDFQAAVEALEKADTMKTGGDRVHRMFLAMAHWQLGNKEKARELYAQGAAWIKEHRKDNEEQHRFRIEAEQLMKITEEDRKKLVEEYLARITTETTGPPSKEPVEEGSEPGVQGAETGKPEEKEADP